jgi:hypothetical protein
LKTRWNAFKAGLRSEILVFDHENPLWNQRLNQWYEYYQPQSPAACHLANECAQASLLADRCHEYRRSELAKQTALARKTWMRAREDEVGSFVGKLTSDPAAAVSGLEKSGCGVRWLIICFNELIDEVETQGYLSAESIEFCVRLFGWTPTPANIRRDSRPYLIYVANLGCIPGTKPEVIDEWLAPDNRPEVFRDDPRDEMITDDPEECCGLLLENLEVERDRLKEEEARLKRDVDGPRLKEVLKRASILDEAAAKRVARSHGESRATFNRGLGLFFRSLDRDAEMGPAADRGEEPVGAVSDPAVGPAEREVESPNDPEDPAVAAAQVAEEVTIFVDPPVSAREPEAGSSSVSPRAEPVPVADVSVGQPEAAAAGPVPAERPAEMESPNDPENGPNDSAQVVVCPETVHDRECSHPNPTDAVLSPAPVLESTPSEAPARPAWHALQPSAAGRAADSLLTEEDSLATERSGQAVDSGESLVSGQPPGPIGPSVPSPAHVLVEPPLWETAGDDLGRPAR